MLILKITVMFKNFLAAVGIIGENSSVSDVTIQLVLHQVWFTEQDIHLSWGIFDKNNALVDSGLSTSYVLNARTAMCIMDSEIVVNTTNTSLVLPRNINDSLSLNVIAYDDNGVPIQNTSSNRPLQNYTVSPGGKSMHAQ